MFKELFFILKALLTTASVVALMQFEVGGVKLETKFHNIISAVMKNPSLNGVVAGGKQVGEETWVAVKAKAQDQMKQARTVAVDTAVDGIRSNQEEIKEQTKDALKRIKDELEAQANGPE